MSDDADVEDLRNKFKRDNMKIDILDFGAGSKISEKRIRTVRSIANGGITPSKYSKLFVQLIKYFNSKNVIELGTSLGVNTIYLAKSAKDVKISTFEGCTSIAAIACQAFHHLDCNNIDLIQGNISDTLQLHVKNTASIDLVFFDAYHTRKSTLAYLELVAGKLSNKAVLIVDDIYWSKDMTRAWVEMIRRFPDATCIDIYQCGIIIIDKNLPAGKVRFVY
jgi:predicted O-methyltransferase YrrM